MTFPPTQEQALIAGVCALTLILVAHVAIANIILRRHPGNTRRLAELRINSGVLAFMTVLAVLTAPRLDALSNLLIGA